MTEDFVFYVVAGFAAQLIDGALGMAYGISATTFLMSFGVSPALASATVHVSECVTTGASAVSHHAFGNINPKLMRKLLAPGALGAVIGAYILTSIPGETFRPWVSGYLILMGSIIIIKSFREFPPRNATTHLSSLAFFGGLVDALGGGGWGPIVASTLMVRGNDIRITIGSVNAVEFFITLAASVTFLLTIDITNWQIIFGLGTGGLLAAPLGAWVCKRVPTRPFMVLVGVLVIVLSVRTILEYL